VAGELRRYDEYMASLPSGLASYPACEQKAALYRGFLKEVALGDARERLPEPLRDLVENPRRESSWIPEVHGIALWLAACDLVMRRDHDLVEAVYRMNKQVLTSALYRIMCMVVSPSILFAGGSARWSAFHRGSRFETRGRGPGRIRLSYPRHLFPKLAGEVYARVFDVVLEVAGSDTGKVSLVSWSPTLAVYEATWT
jgi:hypothetical protein